MFRSSATGIHGVRSLVGDTETISVLAFEPRSQPRTLQPLNVSILPDPPVQELQMQPNGA